MIPAAPKMLQAVSTPNHKQKKTQPGLALVSVIRSCARSTGRSSQCVEVYPCIGGRDEATGKRLDGALEGLGSGKVPIRALYLGGPKHAGAAQRGLFWARDFGWDTSPSERCRRRSEMVANLPILRDSYPG
ncbi:hypothetical protein ACVI1J_010133 [Bradyrhizobium diazoefficiens]